MASALLWAANPLDYGNKFIRLKPIRGRNTIDLAYYSPLSLATKTKENVKVDEDKKQLEKRLMERVKELETSLDTKTKECEKMGEDKGLLEKERKAVEEMKTNVEV